MVELLQPSKFNTVRALSCAKGERVHAPQNVHRESSDSSNDVRAPRFSRPIAIDVLTRTEYRLSLSPLSREISHPTCGRSHGLVTPATRVSPPTILCCPTRPPPVLPLHANHPSSTHTSNFHHHHCLLFLLRMCNNTCLLCFDDPSPLLWVQAASQESLQTNAGRHRTGGPDRREWDAGGNSGFF